MKTILLVDDCIIKPFEPMEFQAKIKKWIG